MKKLLVVVAILLSSCGDVVLKKEQTNNYDLEIEFLFEKDGIKVYRFHDNLQYHYFTNKGETITSQRSGKTNWEENIK